MSPEEFETAVREECGALADLLIAKNRAYGDAALNPVRVFSKASFSICSGISCCCAWRG